MNTSKFKIYITIFATIFFFQCKLKTESKKENINDTRINKVYIDPNYSEETIEPVKHKSVGKIYHIFIHNETDSSIMANEKVKIKSNESFLFKIPDTMGITLDNGIQFFFGEAEGLEVIDHKIQVAGLGGEWLDKLDVPDSADWAFSIVNVGKGDPILE